MVWCSCWKNSGTLLGDIISVGNTPLSEFFPPLCSGARTVDSTKYFFLFSQS
uniref:Macaca fascicularis brain cDNA clone: QmoA-11623, similar to human v-ral simian leukemia viral oncogene homolog A (rasrelated) (RALA), mRNA, RefSeq: NM_005402.2 n=1 Tax=Macaca fascicularis TaxID=9541 RepID=I7GH98_MACFA|nr:unnamed protein product [Macaca fascicularis]